MPNNYIISTATALLVSLLPGTIKPPSIPSVALPTATVTVTKVKDGDTIAIVEQGKTSTVRLACVDSPERKQNPWGEGARVRLDELLGDKSKVRLRKIATDRYGRAIAEVFADQNTIPVNLHLVQEGQSFVYRNYLSGCDKERYLQVESVARDRQIGVWSSTVPVQQPWEWRRCPIREAWEAESHVSSDRG